MPAAPADPGLPHRGAARGWPDALRLGVVLAAGELALTRISSGEQVAGITISVSLIAVLTLAALPALAIDLAPLPPPVRLALHTLAGWGLCALIGLGMLGPVVAERAGTRAALASAVGLLAAIAILSRWPRRPRRDPYPTPRTALVFLAFVVGSAWALGPGSPPAAGALGALVAVGGAIGALAARVRWVPLAGLAGVLVARVPGLPMPVAWADRSPGQGPDLVLITIDALRFDAAEAMASYRALAAEGTTFAAAQAPSPWTLPSMASLLTGVPPARHGAGARRDGSYSPVHGAVPSLAGLLADRGYDTVGVAAPNPFVGASFGLDRGFDHFYQPGWSRHSLPRGLQNLAACPILVRVAEKSLKRILCRSVDGGGVTDHALQVLSRRRDRPLFLWIHYLDTHLPYAHTADPTVSGPALRVVTGDFRAELDALPHPPQLRAELWAAYTDEVRFVDGEVARLLAALGPAPPAGRIVAFTADHGEEFFEHGGFEHGHALYQEVVHVPMVVTGLARPPGTEAAPVTLVDLSATLLAAAGGHSPDLTGVDLAGAVPEGRALRSGNMLRVAPDRMYAVRNGRWKAIRDRDRPDALYDLDQDPEETQDVAAQHPETAQALLVDQPPLGGEPSRAAPLDAEAIERLEALGYLTPAR